MHSLPDAGVASREKPQRKFCWGQLHEVLPLDAHVTVLLMAMSWS
jgi:hypothetical protein